MAQQVSLKNERKLFSATISSKPNSELISATDLAKAGNRWRFENGLEFFNMSQWFTTKSTKEFINELEAQFGTVKITARGRGHHTWVHPYLFIDLALAINPKLKIEVYSWLFDYLLKYRNESGDSYKYMVGCLYDHTVNKRYFPAEMQAIAMTIRNECGVEDWQKATEEQLKYRRDLQGNIALLASVLNNNSEAVRLAIIKTQR